MFSYRINKFANALVCKATYEMTLVLIVFTYIGIKDRPLLPIIIINFI